MIGLVAGAIWAYLSIYMGWNQFTIDWIAPFGQIFINLLKLIAIPLVLFSIISGVAELSDISTLGRMGLEDRKHLPDDHHFCRYDGPGSGECSETR